MATPGVGGDQTGVDQPGQVIARRRGRHSRLGSLTSAILVG
jgi:hypothetical protein